VRQVARDTVTGRGQGVSEGNGATAQVGFVGIKAKFFFHGQVLRGEGLVYLTTAQQQ